MVTTTAPAALPEDRVQSLCPEEIQRTVVAVAAAIVGLTAAAGKDNSNNLREAAAAAVAAAAGNLMIPIMTLRYLAADPPCPMAVSVHLLLPMVTARGLWQLRERLHPLNQCHQ